MKSMRPTLYGSRHAVSAGHYLAAAAGFAILEAGGNAIDAGCAAGIALAVLHPDEVNVAGVAPIMIRTGQGKVITIAGLGHWPAKFPANLFMREHGGKMPLGLLRTVVPAAPDAWITALSDYGTMSFGDVAGAAIRHAREGFAVFEYMATMIKEYEAGYRSWPSNAAIFLPGGKLPQVGDRFLQTDLAGTLQYMVDQERTAAKHGRIAGLRAARAAFYCGDIAETIVRYHEQEGGYLARDDLANFHSRYEEPVSVRWRDFEVFTCGPWCQGPMLAQALRMIEASGGLKGLAHNSADYIHLVTEILKAACADREYRYGDPLFVDVGLDELSVGRPCRGPRRRDRPRARHARHAAAARPASQQPAAAGIGVAHQERRHHRTRHLLLLRRRPLGQCDVGHALGRIVALAGHSRPRHRALGARHAIAARSPASLRRGAGQAAPAHAQPGHRRAR
jgi:gamma-glutamyltranspeptidase / glutathione hydrolase